MKRVLYYVTVVLTCPFYAIGALALIVWGWVRAGWDDAKGFDT